MDRFDYLLEDFKKRPDNAKHYDIGLMKEELTKCCDVYIDGIDEEAKRIEGLEYLCSRCDYMIKEISETMGLDLDFTPNQEYLEKVLEDGPTIKTVSQQDWDIYEETGVVSHSIIEALRNIYEEEHKEAVIWCNDIKEMKGYISEMVEALKDKAMFFDEVSEARNKNEKHEELTFKDIIGVGALHLKGITVEELESKILEAKDVITSAAIMLEYGVDFKEINGKKINLQDLHTYFKKHGQTKAYSSLTNYLRKSTI